MARHRRFFRLGLSKVRRDREVEEELESHIAMRVEQLVAQGLSPAVAREEALRRLGGLDAARAKIRGSAATRDERLKRAGRWDALHRDLALTWRRIRGAPGYTLLVILSLGLGIGLTTTVFTVVDGVVLRPLPYPDNDRLVALYSVTEELIEFPDVSAENWLDWQEGTLTLESTAIHDGRRVTVSLGDRSVAARGLAVAGAFFETIAPNLLTGRAFSAEEIALDHKLAVISEGFWRTALNAPSQLPTALILNGEPHQVVGVVSDGFGFPASTEIWLPDPPRRLGNFARNNINWLAVGKLREGVAPAEAKEDLGRVADRIREQAPEARYSWGVGVIPLKESIVGAVSDRMMFLLAAVAFVLLITCANVAGLGVARTLMRRHAIGVRIALGAGRAEIVRQIVVEHLLLCLLGGALGVAVAAGSTGVLVDWAGPLVPRGDNIGLDGRVVAFALTITLITGVLAALIPAFQAAGVAPASLLGGTAKSVGGRGRALSALVVGEVTVALLLLTGGGLLVRSFGALVATDLGFESTGVVTVETILNTEAYRGEDRDLRRVAYWEDLMDRLRNVSGVSAVGVGNWIPTGSGGRGFVEFPGRTLDEPRGAGYRVVSDDYFTALGIPVLQGRSFGPQDALGTERVVLVNARMVEEFWPGRNPVGELVQAVSMEGGFIANPAPELRVIGVVGDIRHFGYDAEPDPEMFTLHRQVPPWNESMTVVVRATGDPAALEDQIRRVAESVDPGTAVDVTLMDDRLSDLVRTPRFLTTVLTGFSALALVLAALGIYGLLAFTVAQRIPEIGLRAALGATQGAVLRHVILGAARVVAIGAVCGLASAVVLSRFLESQLYEVQPTDPVAYGAALVLLVAVGGVAALVPASRAARVDPLVALRDE